MAIAFILINVELGGEEEVLELLRQMDEVVEAVGIFGVYDIIVKIEAEDRHKIEDLIIWKIRKFDKVRQTITNWVHTGFNKKEMKQY